MVEITLPPVEEQNRQAEIPDYGRFTLDGADLEKQCLSEARIADFIIAQSQYTFEYLVRRGIDAGRIRIIPLGVDTEKFTPYFRGASSRRPKMLFVGQLGYRKAIWQLITRLDRTEFAQWDLDIVGETVDSVGKWCTECRFPNVHIYGRVSDEAIIDLYHRADVFVMPSLSEGGCNVVMEALACGLPCIVSDAAVSIVTHGESGYVIPRGDMIGFADGLTRLRQNADLRRTMGNRARQIAEKYSWREYRNRLAKFYSSIF
ncbi:MAG TPA: glycosyltransferase family 4 protein [Tepidisphaeraceae bacterium]|nr:glycosyltransferase family 4 protein [Tepidisphaeraceae bacterium]